jgi:hypothetical protein
VDFVSRCFVLLSYFPILFCARAGSDSGEDELSPDVVRFKRTSFLGIVCDVTPCYAFAIALIYASTELDTSSLISLVKSHLQTSSPSQESMLKGRALRGLTYIKSTLYACILLVGRGHLKE